jgi:hypothetical protein
MRHEIDKYLKKICSQIIAENKSEEEWSEIESDDMFVLTAYEGGFDATEMMFCFLNTNRNSGRANCSDTDR